MSDGSVNTQTHVGFGAYLIVPENTPLEAFETLHVKVKKFTQTSSTKLELQTLLWALNEVKDFEEEIMIYTDSQNIITLPSRRERFERNGYATKQKKIHEHAALYQVFYRVMDEMKCSLMKVKGHKQAFDKDVIDRYFTLVDRASREALRKSSL
ncbi:ribonuclease HI [Sulfurospirillum diekertiae]|uniref:Ribonuclease H n=1 Tax=Sulfurospirillum diekertiae TaxID=1854492 RepID=A0A1Y0HMB6_9BACT|nr:RNase H family protein [Sulfurospirillum diekertiae]ARU48514.1 Ribonuclease H [Sulfurospirillum diekertiae]ASC93347.1 Ribonuclease H [Sulfurospirillum diekertiae]